MFLAEKTVKNYVSSILAKLGLERRTQAAVLASKLLGPETSRLTTVAHVSPRRGPAPGAPASGARARAGRAGVSVEVATQQVCPVAGVAQAALADRPGQPDPVVEDGQAERVPVDDHLHLDPGRVGMAGDVGERLTEHREQLLAQHVGDDGVERSAGAHGRG